LATALVDGCLLLPDGPLQAGLRFDRQTIISVGRPPQRGDSVIDLAGAWVYPGLVNAHDHLELNHYPRSKFRPVYANAHHWGEDFLARLNDAPYATLRKLPIGQRCGYGLAKNLASGVTLVAHHNPIHPPLRRFAGLGQPRPRLLRRYGWAHSLHFTSRPALLRAYQRTPPQWPFFIHLAEGTDAVAEAELGQLNELGLLRPNTRLVHGVGLTPSDRQLVLAQGAGLVWCPSSNFFLLGATAQVAGFAEAGRLAIGADSLLTADGNLFDEMRAAWATGQVSAEAIFRAVSSDAARLLGAARAGLLLPGSLPDILVLANHGQRDAYQALINARPSDIVALYVGGQNLVGLFAPPPQAGTRAPAP
jgi:cytosine/adenosine deaminase-related metal-dependent hydrolase